MKWEFDGIGFRKTFGSDPKDVIEVWTIAGRLIISKKLDVICERVTGGPFAVGHHFVPTLRVRRRVEESDEMREYPVVTCSKDLAPSQSDQPPNSPPRKMEERRIGLSHVVMTM